MGKNFKEDLLQSLRDKKQAEEQSATDLSAAQNAKLQQKKLEETARRERVIARLRRQEGELQRIADISGLSKLFADATDALGGFYSYHFEYTPDPASGRYDNFERERDLVDIASEFSYEKTEQIISNAYYIMTGVDPNIEIKCMKLKLEWIVDPAGENYTASYDHTEATLNMDGSIKFRKKLFSFPRSSWEHNPDLLQNALKDNILHPIHTYGVYTGPTSSSY